MQAKRHKALEHPAIDKRTDQTGAFHERRNTREASTDDGPDEVHNAAQDATGDQRYNGDRSTARKKRQRRWKLGLVKAAGDPGDQAAHDNAAKDTRAVAKKAERGSVECGLLTRLNGRKADLLKSFHRCIVGSQASCSKQNLNRLEHGEIADKGRKGSPALLFARQGEGAADSKQNTEVSNDYLAETLKYREERKERRSGIPVPINAKGHKGQFGRKNATDTQKETGNGNERNRNEHCLSERLEFFFHQFPPQ